MVMYPDKKYTRKISISILKYNTLYTRPTLHCSIHSVTPLLIGMDYLYKGGEYCYSLAMHGFCSNKALYTASLSFTMFIGTVAAARQVLQNRVCPSFPFSSVFLELDH